MSDCHNLYLTLHYLSPDPFSYVEIVA